MHKGRKIPNIKTQLDSVELSNKKISFKALRAARITVRNHGFIDPKPPPPPPPVKIKVETKEETSHGK